MSSTNKFKSLLDAKFKGPIVSNGVLNMNVFDSLMVEEIMLSNCSIATFIALEFVIFVMALGLMVSQ